MSFVLHTHDKIEQLSLRCSRLCGFHARSDVHVPQTPDYMICDFQSRAKVIFSLQNTRMKFRTRTRISLVEFALAEGDTKNGSVFFSSVRREKGGMFPGVPNGDRGNWG